MEDGQESGGMGMGWDWGLLQAGERARVDIRESVQVQHARGWCVCVCVEGGREERMRREDGLEPSTDWDLGLATLRLRLDRDLDWTD